MASNKHGFDYDEVVRNAYAQGVDLNEIPVIYEGLTVEEKKVMMERHLLKQDGDVILIASFTDTGELLFPEKVKGVLYLGA